MKKTFFLVLLFGRILFVLACEDADECPGYCTETAGPIDFTGNLDTPIYHPSGKFLVFIYSGNTDDTDPVGLFTIDLQTGKLDSFTTILSPQSRSMGNIDFSPDGQWLTFTSYPGIWISKLNGDSLQQLTSIKRVSFPRWSPDGKMIAYNQSVEPDVGAWIMDVKTRKSRFIKRYGSRSHWHPDGTKLACYLGGNRKELVEYGIDGLSQFTLANEKTIGRKIGGFYTGPYSPAGDKILFSMYEPGKIPWCMLWMWKRNDRSLWLWGRNQLGPRTGMKLSLKWGH